MSYGFHACQVAHNLTHRRHSAVTDFNIALSVLDPITHPFRSPVSYYHVMIQQKFGAQK